MAKNPAINFYTSDFLTGTTFMSNEQVGAYIRLLSYQHQLGHLTEQQVFQITKDELVLSKFKRDKNGNFFNERMEFEIKKKEKYSISRSENRLKIREKEVKKEKTYEKHMKNICNSYEKHMENENINININKNININIIIKDIINYLNIITNSNYRTTTNKTRLLIEARLNEGYTLEDFKTVIDKKSKEWTGTEFEKFLRPETLFSNKFESYLNQKETKKNNSQMEILEGVYNGTIKIDK